MTPLQNLMRYLGFLMSLLYVFVGSAVVWRPEEIFNIPGKYALPLGGLLIVYGVFRAYRLHQKYFQ